MKRNLSRLAIVALVGLTLLLTASTSEAQRRGGGRGRGGDRDGGRGWGGGWGVGVGIGSPYYYSGWGSPYYYGGGSYPGYYGYDYGAPVYAEPQYVDTNTQNSYYPSFQQTQLANPNDAGFVVRVPDPNAEIWFQDYKTQQRGTVRHFESGSLDPNQSYTFQVRARWMQNGQQMDQTRQVTARAGQNQMVDFSNAANNQAPANRNLEQLPPPNQRTPVNAPTGQGQEKRQQSN